MASNKRAQTASSASVLVFIIGLVIILYIMMIPPEDRLALIQGGQVTPGGLPPDISVESDPERNFNFIGPGLVHDTDAGYEHMLGAINLRTRVNSQVFAEDAAFQVVRSYSSEKNKVIPFFVEGKVDNVFMSFVAKKHEGVVSFILNGQPLYENDLQTTNVAPIRIPTGSLQRNNVLEIRVSDVGWKFWKKNEYIIENFKIYGDVTDASQQSSYSTFELRDSEVSLLDSAVLEFYPQCQNSGSLFISVNDRQLFSQIPDCNSLNRLTIPDSLLKTGLNSVEFETQTDSYLIDRIAVKTTLSEQDNLIYYFVLNDDFFQSITTKEVCGEVDGACPVGCSHLDDKDCCFEEYPNGYWCTIPTFNANNRCVANVDRFTIGLCESGYADEQGDPPVTFEGRCGDNTDDLCPAGCSRFFDKDCCLTEDSGNYWCSNLPTIGVSGICVSGLSNDLSQLCPGGYVDEDGRIFSVPSQGLLVDEDTLRTQYNVEVTIEFVGTQDRKRGIVRINGDDRTFNTYDSSVMFDASEFVKSGNNYIQIVPQNSFNLVSISVKIKER